MNRAIGIVDGLSSKKNIHNQLIALFGRANSMDPRLTSEVRHTVRVALMFHKLFGSRNPKPEPAVAGPYPVSETNVIYQLLFCDIPELFRPNAPAGPAPWQQILFAAQPDAAAVRSLAQDRTQESRCRVLAYNWLKKNGQPVPAKELLGVIVEVPLEGGQETLAAYIDGRVRYINRTSKFVIFDSAPVNVREQANKLLAVSGGAIAQLGPWQGARLAPPKAGNARMTFLVSDGLYFGEGPLPGIDRDQIGGPVLYEAGKLLTVVVETALAKKA